MTETKTLHILWTSDNAHTAQLMVLMYATNSMLRGWWDGVTVIVWGAAALLAAENEAVREHIKIAQNVGVRFSACVACARQLGVIEKLESLDIEVSPWGAPLTDLIQSGAPFITV